MTLKQYLNEMSMPVIKNEEDAVNRIRQAYQAAVVKKQPQGDYLGPLQASLKYLGNITNPEKYSSEIKKGKAALKAIQSYGSTKGKQQAKFTSNRGQ